MNPRLLVLLAACLAGCAGPRRSIAACPRRSDDAGQPAASRRLYLVRCPDVLEVAINDHPLAGGRREVGPDGRVGGLSTPVSGLSVPAIAAAIARELRVQETTVSVTV